MDELGTVRLYSFFAVVNDVINRCICLHYKIGFPLVGSRFPFSQHEPPVSHARGSLILSSNWDMVRKWFRSICFVQTNQI